jgi:hypothetical protein
MLRVYGSNDSLLCLAAMTYARKSLVSLQDTPYYHVVARCVRRAWLRGVGECAGRDYSHRKERIALDIRVGSAIDGCPRSMPALFGVRAFG